MTEEFASTGQLTTGKIGLKTIFNWIDRRVALSTDTDVDRARKRIMVTMTAMGFPTSVFYGMLFIFLEYFWAAAVAIGYLLLQGLNTIILFRTKRYVASMVFTTGVILVAGGVGQIALGGFTQSGGLSMIAILGPTVALLGLGRRAGVIGITVFVFMEAGLAFFEDQVRTSMPGVPDTVSFALLVFNVLLVGTIVFTTTALIVAEVDNARSLADGLLLNILPAPIAEQLKRHQGTIADGYDEVTVLFADIVDFTTMSASAQPRDIVNMLNDIYSDFDLLVQKHGLEKIKTIGDSYMVAGGLPVKRADHDSAVADFALDMINALEKRRAWNNQRIRVRVGINTGPVVAGVIGRHKFIYDLWGDAVNTASRMESHAPGNTIQVTEATYRRLKNRYEFEERGLINVKGKGEMTTYLLRGRKLT